MADPICTFVFSILVLCTTFTILRDILLVLMEGEAEITKSTLQCSANVFIGIRVWFVFSIHASGTPSGVKYSEVRDGLLAVKGVTAVHNLHIWALTVNQAMLSAHVAIGKKELGGGECYLMGSLLIWMWLIISLVITSIVYDVVYGEDNGWYKRTYTILPRWQPLRVRHMQNSTLSFLSNMDTPSGYL